MKINKPQNLLFIGILSLVTFFSCEKETIVPVNYKDMDFSFSKDIQPIIDNTCLNCHTFFTKGDSYDELKSKGWITTDTTKTENSRLYDVAIGHNEVGRLTNKERDYLIYWMKQGAKDN